MIIMHRFQLDCICPENGMVDRYEVEVHTDRKILCEDLLAIAKQCRGQKIYQEDLTSGLAQRLKCKVVTTGSHCNGLVTTRVEC
jgi:hypothetical protein